MCPVSMCTHSCLLDTCLDLAGIIFEYLYCCFHSVPSFPTDVSVQPLYRVDGSIQYVDVGFNGVVSFKKLMHVFPVHIHVFTVI